MRIGTCWWVVALTWLALPPAYASEGACLAAAAREQVGVTLRYDPAYVRLDYPGGDVPADRGVCTDVVVRAYRRLGLDLQRLVHEDMRVHFDAYPPLWGLRGADRNIDHRRVPNLNTYFRRHGQELPLVGDPARFAAGDLVSWELPGGLPHIGIVSDRRSAAGMPLVIHNIGAGTREEDVLLNYPIRRHQRFLPTQLQDCPRP